MTIGIPKEIKKDEYRVSITPSGVLELIRDKNQIFIEDNAGLGSGFSNQDYIDAGASILSTAKEVFDKSQLIVKVKEPIKEEYHLFSSKNTLFTYLHLSADKPLTEFLLEKNITAFGYETLTVDESLPLLEPMSEVAGKMASLMGIVNLSKYSGGSGILASGVVGTQKANVVILGGGVAGKSAAQIALGVGANVTILDINLKRLHYLEDIMPNISTLYSTKDAILKLLPTADIIIGTVLIAGAKAPKLITKDMLKIMKKGSVLVDVSIDQGGCFETSMPTTHTNPTFVVDDILHYCVANMPGAYPKTSTYALTNATLPYIKILTKNLKDKRLISALNTSNGLLYNKEVGLAHNIKSEII